MKTSTILTDLFKDITQQEREETKLAFDISNRIYELMQINGLSKRQLANAFGTRPSEITKWLSGQHNFTIGTISKLSSFFGQPIISVR